MIAFQVYDVETHCQDQVGEFYTVNGQKERKIGLHYKLMGISDEYSMLLAVFP